MHDLKGIGYLRKKLALKRERVLTRYKYYEMKNIARDFQISTPPELAWLHSSLGWCAKAVDSLSDRLVFNEFRNDNFDLNTIFNMNNPDTLFDAAKTSAMIGSCSFVYISAGEDGYPILQVVDGANATGVIDQSTGLLTEGYAVLKRGDYGEVLTEAYFKPNETWYYYTGEAEADIFEHPVNYPLLVPIIYRPDDIRPFGHSRISRACMSLVNSALRTVKRSEIAAEFYSFPQKYITGLSEDVELMDKWKATISSMMAFTKDEDGGHPVVGQFQQQSMTPHNDQLKMFASLFAGETGLTLDDLGFATANPSSADAIKAAHDSLRLTARKAQRTFGSGFLNAGFIAACLRDEYQYKRNQLYMTKPVWEPIFEPDASMLSSIGDGVLKLNQAMEGFIDEQIMGDLTGIHK